MKTCMRFDRRSQTPSELNVVRSDGLVLVVGNEGLSQELAVKLVEKIVERELAGTWIITPLGEGVREFIIRRPATEQNPTTNEAFDLAYKLRGLREVEDCEPALVYPNEAPSMLKREFMLRQRSLGASSSSISTDGDTPLPCSANHEWPLLLCRVREAWGLAMPPGGLSHGEGIVIGHPDTGYTSHPELDMARVLASRGRDFEEGDRDPRDGLTGTSAGHGTSTGSVIMSGLEAAGGSTQISGVAPKAQLVPLRVTNNVVLLSYGKLAEAIRYAADDGQHVLSISLGGPWDTRFLHRAILYAVQRGVIIVAAAGNVWPFVVYPAGFSEVVAAAACNCLSNTWSRSASGAAVDITAPGESVWRALSQPSGFSVAPSSGTSYATAITAGAAALWLAYHNRQQLISRYGAQHLAAVFKELLVNFGFDQPVGWDTRNFGPGILNVKKLLEAPLPDSAPAGGLRSVRSATLPRSRSQVDRLVELFPNVQPSIIRAGLAQMLGTTEAELNVRARDVADEVAYYAVLSQEFRERISNAPSATNVLRAEVASSVQSDLESWQRQPPMSTKLSHMVKASP